jgi:tetratricopeptide (TPR) repeat protein/transglutaminase-like putative cysteine protease
MAWRFRLHFRLALSFVILVLCSVPAFANEWPVARAPSREPAPYRYDAASWKGVPRAFLEDFAACILYSGTTHLVDGDGTIETITHEITRLNGRKGIDKLGEYHTITYSPSYQKVTLNTARVIKADGQVVEIEPKHLQLRDQSTDYQVYDHDKQLVIWFPNLEVGDVYEVKWTVRGKNPEHFGHFFTRYTFGDDHYPVVRDELRVRLPKDRPLRYGVVNGKVEPVIREEGMDRSFHWSVNNRPALPQDESLPSKEELRLQVACSTFASWEEVGKWKEKLRTDCWTCSPAIRKVVMDVTKGLKTPEEKARALAYWVRRRIRYVSVGPIRHDYTPHLPDAVLDNLFGDCKDQAQLLALMLREAGLLVYLVTLGALDDGQVMPEVPSPWGTHAILLVPIDGHDHWIDTTATFAPWNFLPRDNRDRVAYVTDHKGGIRVTRTPALSPANNRFQQATQVAVQPDGTSRCQRSVTYHGSAAVSQRDAWIEVPVGERRRLLTAELQDANSRARLRTLTVEDAGLHDLDKPVKATMEFDIRGHFSGEVEREGSLTDSKVWGRLLAYNLDPDRKVAFDLGSPFESVHRYEVKLPAAYRFDGLPHDAMVRSRWGTFQVAVFPDEKEPRRLEVEFRTRLEKMHVEPADFAAYRKFHEGINKAWRVWLTLKPTEDLADAPLLEAQLATGSVDSTSAAILAGLYQRHGRADDARRVLRKARLAHPDSAMLWELTAKTAPTVAEEEAAYGEMVKRFPGEARYAVALGATRVKRGDHAGAATVLAPLAKKASPAVRGAAHYHLARSAFQQQKTAAALEHLEAAARADRETMNSEAAWHFKGRVLEQLGQLAEAAEAYRQALKVDAEAEDALAALIRLDLKANRRGQALVHLRRYALAVGDDDEGLTTAAEFYLQLGRVDDALELATRTGADQPNPRIRSVLGLAYFRRGDYQRAAPHLEQGGKGDEVTAALLRCYLALGKLEAAEQVAASVQHPVRLNDLSQASVLVDKLAERRREILASPTIPANRKALWRQAADAFVCAEEIHSEGRPVQEVEKLLASAFVEEVELGPAFALRGLIALEKGRLTAALTDAERSLKLNAREARGYYVRGRVRLEREDRAALIDLARATVLTGRKDPMVLHWLALAFFRAGDHSQALTLQREAVRLRPQDTELTGQLRDFERAMSTSPAKPASTGPVSSDKTSTTRSNDPQRPSP